uniref:CHK kinase-like domain-containing protein n=1 Tax=Parascaris univalens TaxID=6257 RepID=A0A915AWT0_PARUN
ECTVYEWFAKQKKLAVPRTLHIKKHSSESSCGVIVMEDLGEKGQQGSLRDGLAIDGAKDLLRNLAMIHAKSLLSGDWTTMVPDISPLHYRDLAGKSEEACGTFLKNLSDEQKEELHSYLCADYLTSTVTEIGEYGMDRVLIHGQPMAINLILQGREKVIGILDWAKAHPGCFAEDVATAICWNLEPKERHCNEQRLLEFYHYNLVKYGAGNCQVTLEQVRKAYAHFLPLAMSVLILLAVNIDMSNDTKDAIVERSEMLANDI